MHAAAPVQASREVIACAQREHAHRWRRPGAPRRGLAAGGILLAILWKRSTLCVLLFLDEVDTGEDPSDRAVAAHHKHTEVADSREQAECVQGVLAGELHHLDGVEVAEEPASQAEANLRATFCVDEDEQWPLHGPEVGDFVLHRPRGHQGATPVEALQEAVGLLARLPPGFLASLHGPGSPAVGLQVMEEGRRVLSLGGGASWVGGAGV
mmetsp:Transcript_35862/g.101518  ORF Transcript_35862/g.101518 Transcript_35862/m.101518 type:complete len:210 (+) Transcript_35862:1199-1828(+)